MMNGSVYAIPFQKGPVMDIVFLTIGLSKLLAINCFVFQSNDKNTSDHDWTSIERVQHMGGCSSYAGP